MVFSQQLFQTQINADLYDYYSGNCFIVAIYVYLRRAIDCSVPAAPLNLRHFPVATVIGTTCEGAMAIGKQCSGNLSFRYVTTLNVPCLPL